MSVSLQVVAQLVDRDDELGRAALFELALYAAELALPRLRFGVVARQLSEALAEFLAECVAFPSDSIENRVDGDFSRGS